MPKVRTDSTRRYKRERHDRQRHEQAAEARAQQTQDAQARAAERRRRYRSHRRRRIVAWTLFVLAIVMAGSHVLEHFGAFQLMSPGLQDLLIGWPMAIVIGIVAAIVAGTGE